MGYSHYWTMPPGHRAYVTAWATIVADTRRIIDAVREHGVVIAGPDGWRRPTLDPHEHGIAFNGDASTDLAADTFALAPPLAIAPAHPAPFCCKTNGKPYDVAVAAVLLRCTLLLPDVFLLRSDGTWDGEWARSASPVARRALPSPRDIVAALFGPVPDTSPFADPTIQPYWEG
ncbi:MAG TPA: hypothetical protein VK453_12140 [Micromonosporaceae bacterium]|nr:hypothetical protein [Micromonosporaceae bacterium]